MSSGVEFEEIGKSYGGYRQPGGSQGSGQAKGMAGWLIRHHFAKSESGAQKVMMAIAVVDFVIAIIVAWYFLR